MFISAYQDISLGRELFTAELVKDGAIPTDACFMMEDPDGLSFALISSIPFMIWQKTVGGRIKSDCRFADTLIWNTFPLPKLTDTQRSEIVKAGQGVIKARNAYEVLSLADLYKKEKFELYPELVKAHKELDKSILDVYGLDGNASEGEVVAGLVEVYNELTEKK